MDGEHGDNPENIINPLIPSAKVISLTGSTALKLGERSTWQMRIGNTGFDGTIGISVVMGQERLQVYRDIPGNSTAIFNFNAMMPDKGDLNFTVTPLAVGVDGEPIEGETGCYTVKQELDDRRPA